MPRERLTLSSHWRKIFLIGRWAKPRQLAMVSVHHDHIVTFLIIDLSRRFKKDFEGQIKQNLNIMTDTSKIRIFESSGDEDSNPCQLQNRQA